MKANVFNKFSIGGFLFSIQPILTTKNLHVISNLKLKTKLLPPPCLDKAYLFEAKENKIRGWGAKS